jgi:hypothetical protein
MRFAKVEALWDLHSNHEIASQEDIDQVYFDMRVVDPENLSEEEEL